jgi:hypothetical protein
MKVKIVLKELLKDGHPAADYLVVEDPKDPATWSLPCYDEQHLGGAHAALMSAGGFRGNKYEGPKKEEAIAKLKAAYKKHGKQWPEDAKKDDKTKQP